MLDLSPIYAVAVIAGGALKICAGNDPEREVRNFQVYAEDRVGVVMQLWALDREHARMIADRAEGMLTAAGQHKRGRFYNASPEQLERVLRAAAEELGLPLMSDAERLQRVQREAGV